MLRLSHVVLGLLVVSGLAVPAAVAGSKNFVITVDGSDAAIGLDEPIRVKTSDGKEIEVLLRKSDIGTYSDGMVEFQHAGAYSVTSTEVDKGIRQHMVATARGTVLLVQEYDNLDPSSLTTLMLTELTKEDVKAGGQLSQEQSSRPLVGGKTMQGVKAQVVKPSGTVKVEVMTYGADSKGIIAVTRIEDFGSSDQPLLDDFWATLSVKF